MNLNNSSVSFGVESSHSTFDMAILTKSKILTNGYILEKKMLKSFAANPVDVDCRNRSMTLGSSSPLTGGDKRGGLACSVSQQQK